MKKSVSKLPTLNKQKITLAYFGAKLAMEKKGSEHRHLNNNRVIEQCILDTYAGKQLS